ncbi:hypothetical protein CRM22_002517 [Opisthorchis felineus]|uniref:RNA (guanine-9-)-methyltransferase domain-containing protein 1 n=2 Tax=Opisthorchis felineus TaxID=147828 RepID=A0A4V3SGB3_OPIFE|nr:hypothetical protein CRM22_002517 [Opisthorchis felineus]
MPFFPRMVSCSRNWYRSSSLLFKCAGNVHRQTCVPAYLMDRTKPAEEILKSLTPEDSARLEVILAEYQLMADKGWDVPAALQPLHKLDLLCCTSHSARMRHYEFLFKKEKMNENKIAKKLAKPPRENLDTAPASDDRIIRMIGPKCIRLHHEDWMWAEIRCPDSAQQLVFDFSHESEMRLQDQKNLAAQFLYVMRTARLMRPYPFHLNLCGLLPGTNQYAFMEQAFGIETPGSSVKTLADIPWTISPNHYTVDFPLNDLSKPVIYLSPNAPRCFEPGEWDHTAVYVIGAVVDKSVRRPVTLAKARRAGVQCIRLPLERYFNWSPGSGKCLTLNCIHDVMATAKSTNGDWETALRSHVPKRLYMETNIYSRQVKKLLTRI